jgi:hypothetical protein
MSFLNDLFGLSGKQSARFAVIQYTRPAAGYHAPGGEQGFHWALVALRPNLTGIAFQANNMPMPDPSGSYSLGVVF